MTNFLVQQLNREQKKELKRVGEDLFAHYRLTKYMEFSKFEGQLLDTESDKNELRAQDREFCERVERWVDRLPAQEREILKLRYMNAGDDYTLDYQIEMELGISEKLFNDRRYYAFVKLAEVFKLDYGAELVI